MSALQDQHFQFDTQWQGTFQQLEWLLPMHLTLCKSQDARMKLFHQSRTETWNPLSLQHINPTDQLAHYKRIILCMHCLDALLYGMWISVKFRQYDGCMLTTTRILFLHPAVLFLEWLEMRGLWHLFRYGTAEQDVDIKAPPKYIAKARSTQVAAATSLKTKPSPSATAEKVSMVMEYFAPKVP